MQKCCNKCKTIQDLTSFYKKFECAEPDNPTHYSGYCRECERVRRADYMRQRAIKEKEKEKKVVEPEVKIEIKKHIEYPEKPYWMDGSVVTRSGEGHINIDFKK